MSDNKKFLEQLLKDRYYQADENCWNDICARVANFVAQGNKSAYNRYYKMMSEKRFCPASPIVMSAGTKHPMLSSCFVLPLGDSMEEILTTIKNVGLVTCAGGGIGFDFSPIRKRGSLIKSLGKNAALGPVGVVRMINGEVNELSQSGRRKGACMGSISVYHDDMPEFITLKNIDGKISNFNLSVLVDDAFMNSVNGDLAIPKNVKRFNLICKQACETGCPGLLFEDTINRGSKFRTEHGIEITAANTCVTGDTLVAVADGRNYVSIKELAESGKDVLVHCVDPETGESHVRMGRAPRLTRKNQDVYRVTLDDGSYIKVTEDHKFLLRDGSTVETKDLNTGDSLWAFNKYQAVNTTKGKRYWNVVSKDFNGPVGRKCGYKTEHGMMMKYAELKPSDKHICHHIDDDSLNNTPSNLKWITISDHNRLENALRGGFIGENNPMFGRTQKESTKKLIKEKAVERYELGDVQKKISDTVTELHKDPEYREKFLKGIKTRDKDKYTMAVCAYCKAEHKILRTVLAEKSKNKTGKIYCSQKCCNTDRNSIKLTRDEMISMGHDCLDKLGKIAWKTWELEYKKVRSDRPSTTGLKSHFGSWKNFTTLVKESYNHKVVSVEYVGKDDVYNITVDEFHTVSYVTDINAATRINGLSKISGINTRQCGEIPMPPMGNCLLGSVNMASYVKTGVGYKPHFDWDAFKVGMLDALEFTSACIGVNKLPLKEQQDFMEKYRQIGVGVTGFHDALILLGKIYGSDSSFRFARATAKIMKECADHTSKKFRNIASLTLAPTGSVSLMLGVGSFAIEPILFKEMDRVYKCGNGDVKTYKVVHPLWEKRKQLSLDEKLFVEAMDISPADHLEMVSIFQAYIDNAISKTIILPSGSDPETVRDIFLSAWSMGLKGITVYVDQSKSGQVYSASDGNMEEIPDSSHAADGDDNPDETSIVTIESEKKKRPRALLGKTYKCRNGSGSFYITINEHDGTAFEIFSTPNVNIEADPARSHEAVINTEALTRIISLCLRTGIEPKLLAEQLYRVKNQSLISLPKQIADILNDFNTMAIEEVDNPNNKMSLSECPSCHKIALAFDGSCSYCQECGWSKCS